MRKGDKVTILGTRIEFELDHELPPPIAPLK
jgi:hypothetical protein